MGHSKTTTDVTRRTLMRAAAWSVPVVAVAVATPLAAASRQAEFAVDMAAASVDGATFTWPGALIANNGTTPLTLTWSIEVTPTLESLNGPITGTITIPPQSSATVAAGVTGYYVAAAWETTLVLTLLHDGSSQTSAISFRAREM
ncbi:MAG: hypothetical protein K0R99_1480 [Microbacterium sp.]|jgi:hypothetical protein|uniref:hypothetical protein n=1 Tax=Microbacterium sp. TaxID=51671 RepID=UPI002615F3B7|nr:hypothetical protein [Microbacterium sp.]MDF2560034.1 hypothetical protein [Microbacterium sp.]